MAHQCGDNPRSPPHARMTWLAPDQLVAGFLRGLNLSAGRTRTESGYLHSQIG
ncbi:hypothetical protein P3T25_009834 [Paraburkholderia sp. GAS32]